MNQEHKGYPTPQEKVIIKLYNSKPELSVFEIAHKLFVDPQTVMRVVNYWCNDVDKPQEEKETAMAKKDKNKDERAKSMTDLRSGKPLYSMDPDKLRGLVTELEEGECFIIMKQSSTNNLNVRLGDFAYST
jgi:hypothetical protein